MQNVSEGGKEGILSFATTSHFPKKTT